MSYSYHGLYSAFKLKNKVILSQPVLRKLGHFRKTNIGTILKKKISYKKYVFHYYPVQAILFELKERQSVVF